MRIDGINPQPDSLSEDFVPVHLAALVAGHHFAHRRWFAVEDSGEAVDDGLGGGGQRHEAGRGFDQRVRRRTLASALDHVALPSARDEAVLDLGRVNTNALTVQDLPLAISQPIVLAERQRR